MTISLCIICKDEEENIQRCINSVKNIVNEIIVVDTGSTDQTITFAEKEGAIVYQMEWENDFAKVRNYALSKATGEWIIFLDADEYVDENTAEYIRSCIDQCIEKKKNILLGTLINLGENSIIDTSTTLRIFANKSYLRYIGKVHERVISKDASRQVSALDGRELINVYHTGYSKKEVERKDKYTRNEQMLLKELHKKERGIGEYGRADIHYYLTEVYQAKKDNERLLFHGKEALKCKDFRLLGTHHKTYCNLLSKMIELKVEESEIEKYYKESIAIDSFYPDFEWYYAQYFLKKGKEERAIQYIEACIQKIESYQGMVQSYLMIKINELYHVATEIYMKSNDIQNALIKLVKLLKVDKYDYKALRKLFVVLDGKEEVGAVATFLEKIYDYNAEKDRVVLVQVAKSLDSKSYYNYFYKLLTDEEKKLITQ